MMERIVLVGFMGAGKSTVAKHLARLLKCKKLDLDDFIEENEGATPAEIITKCGEKFFRNLETEYLKRALETDAKIIALGGGTWLKEENRQLIKEQNCTTIWLVSTFERCWLNIQASSKRRPLAENKQKTESLFSEREKVYCLADLHIPIAPHLTSEDIAKIIAETLSK